MRILHFVPNFQFQVGGRDEFVRGLVKHLEKYNVYQSIVTNTQRNNDNYSVQQPTRSSNGKVVVFSLKLKKLGAYWVLEGLYKILTENKFDIINIHGYGEYPADVVCILKRIGRLKTPIVLTTHGIAGLKHGYIAIRGSYPLSWKERMIRIAHLFYDFTLGRLEMASFDKVIILSDEEKYYLSKIGLEEQSTLKIPVAIDDIFFGNEPNLSLEGSESRRKYILYAGRIDRYKGIDVLLKAIQGLKSSNVMVKCLIVGPDGGYRAKLESYKNRLQISDLVQIIDQVPKENLVNIYSSALVTVLPSLSEGFPLTLVESMARGTPFISTAVGYVPELVQITNAGMIVPVGDVDSLTKSLRYLLNNTRSWTEMSENGRKFAQNYRWSIVGKKYYQIYTDLTEEFAKRG